MSTRVVRSLADFIRHGFDVDVACECGHKATLDAHEVYRIFEAKGWSTSMEGACWLPSVQARFRCVKCGRVGAKQVGPRGRG